MEVLEGEIFDFWDRNFEGNWIKLDWKKLVDLYTEADVELNNKVWFNDDPKLSY